MGDDPMALLGLEGALKHYYYYVLCASLDEAGHRALHKVYATRFVSDTVACLYKV
jgi:hypothetical protein